MEPQIIFEDNHILVVYKPEGMAVETARITERDLISCLKGYLCEKKTSYLAVVHRIDQPVEGLLVFAKTPFAAKELSRQIQNYQMKKHYLAAVSIDKVFLEDKEEDTDRENGRKAIANPQIMLEDYLFKDGKTNTSRVVTKETKGAKKAILHYQLAGANYQDGIAAAQVQLVTGRHHQIRVQLSHAGMPLLGDLKYGNEISKEKSEKFQVRQVALCAYKLEFFHPKTGKALMFQIEPKKEIFKRLC